MRRSLLPLLVLACTVAACDPQFAPETSSSSGGNRGGTGSGGNGGADVTWNINNTGGNVPPGRHVFRVSASATDPNVPLTAAPEGAFDAYLWLVTSNLGVSALEFDLRHDGAARPEGWEEFHQLWFTPAPTNLSLTWEEGGEMDVAVGSCPTQQALVGTFHLEATGGDIRIEIVPGSPNAGAVPCDYDAIQAFECAPLTFDVPETPTS